MPVMILFDGPGPLPQQATFTAPSDGPVIFFLSGTGRSENSPTLIGITLSIDGNDIGKAMCWANLNDNHQTMRASMIHFESLTLGEHTIEISHDAELTDTVTDENDYFQVALLY